LGSFIHGRFQNLKTSEDTFGHDISPSKATELSVSVVSYTSLSAIIFFDPHYSIRKKEPIYNCMKRVYDTSF